MRPSNVKTRSILLFLLPLAAFFLARAEPYRLSDDFELDIRRDAMPSQLIALEDGSHLAVGGFDSLEETLTGALAILSPEGQFKPLSPNFPVLDAQVEQAVLNSDGSLSVRFTNVASELGLEGDTVIQFSPSGEPILSITNAQHFTLQKDNRFLQITGETDPDQPGKQFTQIQRLIRNSTGDYVKDEGFLAPKVQGSCRAIHILANGKLLATGSFQNADTLATGNLMLLEPDGQPTAGFNRFAYRNEQLEYNEYRVCSLPNGDIFLLFEYDDIPFPVKIGPDGKRDSSFGVANGASIYYKSDILAAGDGTYFVVGPWNQLGGENSRIIKLKANGQIDQTFNFDPDGFFSDDQIELFAAATTENGLLLPGHPSSDPQKIAYTFISADGTLTEAQPGKLQNGKSTAAIWTHSGELLMGNGIARVDGSIRVSFEPDYELKLIPLKSGGFTTADFLFYDENRNRLPVQPHFDPTLWFLAEMPDGTWLAEQRTSKWGSSIGIVKLLRNGSIDPSFPTLAADTTILHVTDSHIYYTIEKRDTPTRDVLRMSHQGIPDPDFSIPKLSGDLAAMKVAGDWIYFPQLTIGDEQTAKPFGARFSLSGVLDENYAPEQTLKRSLPNQNGLNANHFADDGSSVRFACKTSETNNDESESLWYLSPEGAASEIDDQIRWKDAQLDIAPNGDVYISGTALTSLGPLVTSARYTRSPASFSTPFLEKVSYSQGPVQLESTFVDITPESIVWLKDGIEIPGANSPSLEFEQLDASNAGNYLVRIQSGETLAEFGPIRLFPPQAPKILVQPQNSEATANSDLSLRASIDGAPAPELQWYVDGLAIDGATGPTLTLEELSLQDIGTYRLKSTNPLGTQWSEPARVEISGIIPKIETVFDAAREIRLDASALIPAPDAGYFVQSLDDSTSPIRKIRTDYVDENGQMTIDWTKDRVPNGYDSLSLCPFTGTQFAVLTESVPGTSEKITTYTRLTPQGTPDTAFGVHRIDGNYFAEIAFRQWPDGTVWVDNGSAAFEITPAGVETPLPRKEQFVGLNPSWTFIHPLSMRLDDGTYTLTRPDYNWLVHIGTDGNGVPDSDIIDIGYSSTAIQFLGLWANGTQLLHDPLAKTLSGKTFAGEVLWTIDLSGWTIPANNILATQSPDGNRLTLFAHDDLDPQTARIFWVEADGSNNFAEAKTFSGFQSYLQIVALQNNAFAIHGFADTDAYQERTLFIDSESNASSLTKLSRLEPAYLGSPVPSLDGKNLFLPFSGEYIDGALTGPILKLDASGKIDPTFFATFPENALPFIKMVCPLPQGYLAVLRGPQYGYEFEIHVLDPQGAPVSYINLGTLYHPPYLLAHPSDQAGFLLVSIEPNSGESVRFDRYLVDGTLDPNYLPGIKKEQNNYSQVISDSQGRVYLYRRGFNSLPTSLIRVKSNGEIDETFALDPAISQIAAIAVDTSDRLIIGGEQLQRLKENGTIDPTFSALPDPMQLGGLLAALPSGDIIANNKRYDPNGALKKSYASSNSFLSGSLFGERIVSVGSDTETNLPMLRFFSLSGLPKIENQPRSQSVPLGSPLTLTINASEKPGLSYRWSHNGITLPEETSNRLSFDSVQAENAGSYQVTVSWEYGSLTLPEFALATTTPPSTNPTLPPITYQLTPAGLECIWENDPEQTYELFISEDLIAWQIAALPSSSEQRIQKATANGAELPPTFFLKLRPSQ